MGHEELFKVPIDLAEASENKRIFQEGMKGFIEWWRGIENIYQGCVIDVSDGSDEKMVWFVDPVVKEGEDGKVSVTFVAAGKDGFWVVESEDLQFSEEVVNKLSQPIAEIFVFGDSLRPKSKTTQMAHLINAVSNMVKGKGKESELSLNSDLGGSGCARVELMVGGNLLGVFDTRLANEEDLETVRLAITKASDKVEAAMKRDISYTQLLVVVNSLMEKNW